MVPRRDVQEWRMRAGYSLMEIVVYCTDRRMLMVDAAATSENYYVRSTD